MSGEKVISIKNLGAPPWPTLDPFLFCVYHNDEYPQGNENMGPKASLAGRQLGMDFERKDGWSMYHGEEVPGFPQHPHRGFETVTIVRRGLVDHSDSMGATARYGEGDVQWLTAGKGINHAEMFPLVHQDKPNPLKLFQIWLNLPAASKFANPHFTMFWDQDIPVVTHRDDNGRTTEVLVYAGDVEGAHALAPPPDSWASNERADLAMWLIRMDPGATWTLPPAREGTSRVLYFYKGNGIRADGRAARPNQMLTLRGDAEVPLISDADGEANELLLLQGRAIGEPVAKHGPFVMNTQAEIRQAFMDYQATQFGGWPWESAAPVHPREESRHAKRPDGTTERPVART